MKSLLYILTFLINMNKVLSWFWSSGTCLSSEPDLIITALESNLSLTLFGQHLVEDPIASAVSYHLGHQPKKALVLSFHGPPGVGKTFVAKKIGYHLFGDQSDYVKFYSGRNDFADQGNLNIHKEWLSREIKETVEKCPYALFIFDEANYMADGLFDVLRPYTEYLDSYHGIDYRRSMFIFISNIGQGDIIKLYLEKKHLGVKRKDLKLQDFETTLSNAAFNDKGGLRDVSLITNFLVDFYIPFLPLDEEHIQKCIQTELMEQGVQPSVENIRAIYNSLPTTKFVQGQNTEVIVVANCKKIPAQVGQHVANLQRLSRKRAADEF